MNFGTLAASYKAGRRVGQVFMVLRIMLVDENRSRSELLMGALLAAGHEVVANIDPGEDLPDCVERIRPDLIIVGMDSSRRDVLENVCDISRNQKRPVVMFTADEDGNMMRKAVQAGVSAYVVGGLSSERVKPIVEVAMARFTEYQTLRRELEKAQNSLAERKVIDRAKGILMKQRGVSEEEAYQVLRKAAMDRNRRLVDVAESIITAYDLLA